MKKFVVLYMAPPESFARMMREATPEQHRKEMEAWMAWMNKNQSAIIDGGAPLGKSRRVDATGSSDIKNTMGGYSIVQANSLDDAAKLIATDHPHLRMPGAWVEIIEIMPIPGM